MISVVIPAYNEEKLIGACLDGLTRQKTKEKFEVIVVNNNSTDNTLSIIERYKNKLDLKIVNEKVKGRGIARYTGFEKAKGNIIFSTDADAIVPPDWIEKLSTELKKSDAVAISGTLKVEDCGPVRNFLLTKLADPFMVSYRALFGHYWLSGFSFAIYKDVYEKSGKFNSKLNTQEDVDLAQKVSKIGKIKLTRNIPVNFSGRRFKKGIVVGFLPYAKTYISLFWFNRHAELSDVR